MQFFYGVWFSTGIIFFGRLPGLRADYKLASFDYVRY